MVAVANLLPQNPEDEASVLALLREHPELRTFIQQASVKAMEVFPDATIQLDTVRYDPWDPPIRMNVLIRGDLEQVNRDRTDYLRWLHATLTYPEDLVFVIPQWIGESHAGA